MPAAGVSDWDCGVCAIEVVVLVSLTLGNVFLTQKQTRGFEVTCIGTARHLQHPSEVLFWTRRQLEQ